jgi:hypothetical protein
MKHNQAWGWLVAAVVAAGLNSSYHTGDLQWMHRAAEQAKHRTLGVLALATGRADQFLIQAQILAAREQADSRLAVAMSPVQTESTVGESTTSEETTSEDEETTSEASEGGSEVVAACKEVQHARIEAQRDRMQARMEAAQARIAAKAERLQMVQIELNRTLKALPASFNPAVMMKMKSFNPMVKMGACPRLRIRVPQIVTPQIPAVRIDTAAAGPV